MRPPARVGAKLRFLGPRPPMCGSASRRPAPTSHGSLRGVLSLGVKPNTFFPHLRDAGRAGTRTPDGHAVPGGPLSRPSLPTPRAAPAVGTRTRRPFTCGRPAAPPGPRAERAARAARPLCVRRGAPRPRRLGAPDGAAPCPPPTAAGAGTPTHTAAPGGRAHLRRGARERRGRPLLVRAGTVQARGPCAGGRRPAGGLLGQKVLAAAVAPSPPPGRTARRPASNRDCHAPSSPRVCASALLTRPPRPATPPTGPPGREPR